MLKFSEQKSTLQSCNMDELMLVRTGCEGTRRHQNYFALSRIRIILNPITKHKQEDSEKNPKKTTVKHLWGWVSEQAFETNQLF